MEDRSSLALKARPCSIKSLLIPGIMAYSGMPMFQELRSLHALLIDHYGVKHIRNVCTHMQPSGIIRQL